MMMLGIGDASNRRRLRDLIANLGGEEALRHYFPDGLPAVPVVGPFSPIPSHLLRAAE